MGLQRQNRRATGIVAAAALGATLLAGGAPARAQQGDSARSLASQQDSTTAGTLNNTPLTLNLVDADFKSAIQVIQHKTGIQLVIRQNPGHPYERVTVSLNGQPVGEALRLVADAGGADLWMQDGVYFVGPKGSAPKPAPLPVEPPTVEAPAPRDWKVEKIRLKYISAHAALRVLGIESFGEPDYLEQVRISSLKALVDSQSQPFVPHNVSGGLIIQQGPGNGVGPAAPTGQTVYPSGVTNVSNTPTATRSTGGADVSGVGNSPDQGANRDGSGSLEFGRGGQGGFPGGGGGAGGFGGFQGGGQPGGAGGLGGQGQGGAGGRQAGNASLLLPPGITAQDIFAFDGDNSLLLRYDNAQQLVQFEQLINLLDIRPRQLLIRAQFVTVSQNDVSSFGVNWNFTKVNLVVGANLGYQTANTAFVQYAAGNLQTQLSFILSTGRGKVVAAPTATTLNGVPVPFVSTQQVPVFLAQPIIAQNGTVALVPQLTLFPVIVGIIVTPRINGDESITLQGTVIAQDITGTVTGVNGASAPIITGQTVPVQRIIRNGDTMVIGGLVRKNDNVATNSVPLLGDLPLIGTLFRSRNVTTEDTELLVFITPEIIPERVSNIGGAVGAGAALPGGNPVP
jgi:type II secretory pathway component GspD/PulD (secretin)